MFRTILRQLSQTTLNFRQTNLPRSIAFTALLSLPLLLSGCDKVSQEDPNASIKVVTSPDNHPMSYSETSNANEELKGFEIELIQFIFEKLDKKYSISSNEFSGVIASIESGNADIAIASINETEQRKKSVLFSKTYATSSLRVVTRDPIQVNDILSNINGKKVGVQVGTSHADYIHKVLEDNPSANFEVVLFDNIASMMNAMNAGVVDCICVEKITILEAISIPYFVLDTAVEVNYAMIGKNAKLIEDINKILTENADEINKIKEKYGLN